MRQKELSPTDFASDLSFLFFYDFPFATIKAIAEPGCHLLSHVYGATKSVPRKVPKIMPIRTPTNSCRDLLSDWLAESANDEAQSDAPE